LGSGCERIAAAAGRCARRKVRMWRSAKGIWSLEAFVWVGNDRAPLEPDRPLPA
jgi:hypothetical protein